MVYEMKDERKDGREYGVGYVCSRTKSDGVRYVEWLSSLVLYFSTGYNQVSAYYIS